MKNKLVALESIGESGHAMMSGLSGLEEDIAGDAMARIMPQVKEFLARKIEKTKGENFYIDVTKIPIVEANAVVWVCQPPYGGNFMLVEHGESQRAYTLIDTGLGNYYRDIIGWLRDQGVDPFAVEQIVMLHAHPDHNGAVGYWQEEFPHIRIVAHPQWETVFDASNGLKSKILKFLTTVSEVRKPNRVNTFSASAFTESYIGHKAFHVSGMITAGPLEFYAISFPSHTADSVLLVEFSEQLIISGEPLVAPELVIDKDRLEFLKESVRLLTQYGVHDLGDMAFAKDNLRLKRQSTHRTEIYGHGGPQRRNDRGIFGLLPQVRVRSAAPFRPQGIASEKLNAVSEPAIAWD